MTDLHPADDAETPIEDIVPEQPSEEPEAPEAIGDPEPKPEEPPAPAAAQAEPDDKSLPYWARQRVKAEKERSKALEREVEALRNRQPQQPASPMFEDPADQAIVDYATSRAEQVAFNNHLNTSEMIARHLHGDNTVDEMLEWLQARPDIGRWAMGQRNPYQSAIQHYQREKFADEIGNDPDKWREQERERIRQEVLSETQGAQPAQHRPFTPAPASQARSARPNGAWTGPTPINSALKNNF